jgi:hypothetical protein
MDENGPGRRDSGFGNDYEYDEAHDVLSQPVTDTPAPHRVDPPKLKLDPGGDYGYDEAHDFGG